MHLCGARILSPELEAFYLQMVQFHLGPVKGILSKSPSWITGCSIRTPESGVHKDHAVSESGHTFLFLPATLLGIPSSSYYLDITCCIIYDFVCACHQNQNVSSGDRKLSFVSQHIE